MTLERLLPQPGDVTLHGAYASLRLAERAPPDRPYVIANMIASTDGRATIGGRSGALSTPADHELFLDLRTQVDAVMAGTATLGIEGYGPLVRSEQRQQRRVEEGLDPVPIAVTATRSMELPAQTPLFRDPNSRIVVLTNSKREPPPCEAQLIVERLEGEPLDLLAGMQRLRSGHGVRSVLLEGGPTILSAMTAAGLVDELFLTISPQLAGGSDVPTIVTGDPLGDPPRLELVSLHAGDGELFLRYRLGA